jgi:predicted esterase
MGKIFGGLLLSLILTMSLATEKALMKEGVRVWSDREQYLLSGLPPELKFKKEVPRQRCSAREIVFPEDTKRAMVGLYDCVATRLIARKAGFKAYNGTFRVGGLRFQIYIVENPPEKVDCRATNTGGILLALDADVPEVNVSEIKQSPGTGWKGLQQMQKFPGQEYRFAPGQREVKMYVREPSNGINADTGLMLLLHNWGGTWKQTVPWCNELADRYNLITISVNYLQSGESKHDKVPYDHGLLQAVDCLRAVYTVAQKLEKAGVKWNFKRLYAAGGSGGGNVSQMVNKLAPSSFACIVDMCGMPGLTEDIAFGRGNLNAGYSRDPKSPKFLTTAMREIRDPGNLLHLRRQKKSNPNNKVVIVHGQDDCYCSVVDKITIFENMIKADFRPSGYFLTKSDIDGEVITTTGHAIGNRLKVIERYAGRFLKENGDFSRETIEANNFEKAEKVEFPCTGGKYIVDYTGIPTLIWQKN